MEEARNGAYKNWESLLGHKHLERLSSLNGNARNFQFHVTLKKKEKVPSAHMQKQTRYYFKSLGAQLRRSKVRRNENIDGWVEKEPLRGIKSNSFAAGGTRKRFYLRRWFIASIYLSRYTHSAVRVAVVRYILHRYTHTGSDGFISVEARTGSHELPLLGAPKVFEPPLIEYIHSFQLAGKRKILQPKLHANNYLLITKLLNLCQEELK